ncbi:hypothetical protein NKJ52_24360 [Mesorhizobium australicum]|uniref:hypothetical protein n=1 Tax=Mesorhizobium australicum TaxID=536018 RepID=UPI0033365FFE
MRHDPSRHDLDHSTCVQTPQQQKYGVARITRKLRQGNKVRNFNLTTLANNFGSDKGSAMTPLGLAPNKYTYIYDLTFDSFRHESINLLELGLAVGGPEVGGPRDRKVIPPSVQMWLTYFSKAQVFGFDISDFSHIAHPRFTFVRGDAGAEADLRKLAEIANGFDVIIDDASHASFHQQLAFKVLFPCLRPGGLYIIEDLGWQPYIYESILPEVPKTAEFFVSYFEHRKYINNPVLSSEFMTDSDALIASFAQFPPFDGTGGPTRLIVIGRRRADEDDEGTEEVAQTSASTSFAELRSSTAPRTRVFTSGGTVLYIDLPAGELRHGDPTTSPANVVFVADTLLAGSSSRGWLAFDNGATWEPIACLPHHSCLVSRATETAEGTLLEALQLERGLVGFTARSAFVCAEPDGRITLSRAVCSAWESFVTSEDWSIQVWPAETLPTPHMATHSIDKPGVAATVVHPLARARVNTSSAKKKIAFFGPTQWSNGRVYYDLCKILYKKNYIADVIDYRKMHGSYIHELVEFYDLVVAGLDTIHILRDIYGVSPKKILGLSHWTFDIQEIIDRCGRDIFGELAGYGVVGPTLLWDSLTLGVPIIPKIVSLGMDYAEFEGQIPEKLLTVGCASSLSAKNKFGVEIKRGQLAKDCADGAGLKFKPAGFWTGGNTPIHEMPKYYQSVDAVLVCSLIEAGGPMPATEAAAAGRLVISTPVGVFPLRAYDGLGIIAPIDAEKYVRFTTDVLRYYANNPKEFVEKCAKGKEAARMFDWRFTVDSWIELFESARL